MHSGQHAMTARLQIAAQMADLAALRLRRAGTSGTDNILFRLAKSLVAQVPHLPHAEARIDLQAHWLAQLGPLPFAVPTALRFATPGAIKGLVQAVCADGACDASERVAANSILVSQEG